MPGDEAREELAHRRIRRAQVTGLLGVVQPHPDGTRRQLELGAPPAALVEDDAGHHGLDAQEEPGRQGVRPHGVDDPAVVDQRDQGTRRPAPLLQRRSSLVIAGLEADVVEDAPLLLLTHDTVEGLVQDLDELRPEEHLVHPADADAPAGHVHVVHLEGGGPHEGPHHYLEPSGQEGRVGDGPQERPGEKRVPVQGLHAVEQHLQSSPLEHARLLYIEGHRTPRSQPEGSRGAACYSSQDHSIL